MPLSISGRFQQLFGFLQTLCVASAIALTGCGGGGGEAGPATGPGAPAAGSLANAAAASISSVVLGDSAYRLSVMPGESEEFPLTINTSSGDAFDVEVTLGGSSLSTLVRNGQHYLVVNAAGLSAGASLPYKARLKNRTTGGEAEVFGPINILSPSVVGTASIGEAGGDVVANAINSHFVFDALPGAANLNVEVSVAFTQAGGRKLRIQFDRDVTSDDRLMSILELTPTGESLLERPQARQHALAAAPAAGSYPTTKWTYGVGQFTEVGFFRFDASKKRAVRGWPTCVSDGKRRVC